MCLHGSVWDTKSESDCKLPVLLACGPCVNRRCAALRCMMLPAAVLLAPKLKWPAVLTLGAVFSSLRVCCVPCAEHC
jgi:hypothetical protein